MDSKRYTVRKKYIQSQGHYGDVWFIYDNIKKEADSSYFLLGLDENSSEVRKLNEAWEKELEETKWQRDAHFFSYLHRISALWNPIRIYEIKGNTHIQEIDQFQRKRFIAFSEIILDQLECKKFEDKLPGYNNLVYDENFLRIKVNLPLISKIDNYENCVEARNELNNWLKYFSYFFRSRY